MTAVQRLQTAQCYALELSSQFGLGKCAEFARIRIAWAENPKTLFGERRAQRLATGDSDRPAGQSQAPAIRQILLDLRDIGNMLLHGGRSAIATSTAKIAVVGNVDVELPYLHFKGPMISQSTGSNPNDCTRVSSRMPCVVRNTSSGICFLTLRPLARQSGNSSLW
jgi:hypothetical protein